MTETSFDPGGFFQFDLAKGCVRSKGGSRVLLVSEGVLAPLIHSAVAKCDLTAIRSRGAPLGSIVASALGSEPNSASPAQVTAAAFPRADHTLIKLHRGHMRVEVLI